MSEPEGPSLIPVRRKNTSVSTVLLFLLLLGLATYGGWRGYQWATARENLAHSQQELLQRLTGEVAALNARTQRLAQQQTEIGGRLDSGEQRIGYLSDTVDGGRARLQLAAVEQLLLMANDRLLLAHDAQGARQALDQADQRLAALNDPRLLKVREALTRERAALAALPGVDRTGALLRLAEIIRNAPRFPLRARVPERFETASAPVDPAAGSESGLQRVWRAVQRVLSNIFSLRRAEGPAPRLLPAGEEALVAQALLLKLEGARLALLARDHAALRDMASAARDWLRDYYNDGDPAVSAARSELEQLARLNAEPAAPDISRSLVLLRDFFSGAAR